MKLLVDYTQEELVNLTDDQKQVLFLLECAERGVALPESIPAYLESPEERDDLKEDSTLFAISTGRYSSDKFYFKTMEEAEAAVELIRKNAVSVDSTYRSGRSIYYLGTKEVPTIEIESVKVYSADKYAQTKEEISIYESQKSRIDSNNSRRSKIMDEQAKVMQDIDNAISDAERDITRVAELKTIFEKYKTMADGNHEIAVRFMLNAHFNEVEAYEDDKLKNMGLTREDITKYIEKSKKSEDEE